MLWEGWSIAKDQKGVESFTTAKLGSIVLHHFSNFRTDLSSQSPSKPRPLTIDILLNFRTVPVRRFIDSQYQDNVSDGLLSNLIAADMVLYSIPMSQCSLGSFFSWKIGLEMCCLDVDSRFINWYSVKYQLRMPKIAQKLIEISVSLFNATLNCRHVYWMLSWKKNFNTMQYFITLDNIHRPIEDLHHAKNAVMHLQSSISTENPANLISLILIWLNEVSIHASNVKDFLQLCSSLLRDLFKVISKVPISRMRF